jgi:hypothetical protein
MGMIYATALELCSHAPMIEGTIFAFCDRTLGELWRMNISSGFKIPPLGLQSYDDVGLPPVNTD